MKATDDLFQLIKSLTKSEKRYLKINIDKKYKGDKNNYSKLFDAIEKQKVYNEQKIIDQFSDKKFIRHLPSEKNYLYHTILKNLHLYQTYSSKKTSLDQLIYFADMLHSKGLHGQSKKLLDRAKKLSRDNEMFAELLRVLRMERKVVMHFSLSANDLSATIKRITLEVREALHNINNLNRYRELQTEFLVFMRKEGETIRNISESKVLDKVMEDPIMKKESNATSYIAKGVFYWMHALYYSLNGNFEKAYHYFKKDISNAEEYPVAAATHDFSAMYSNMSELCLKMEKYEIFGQYMEKLKKVPANSTIAKSKIFYRYYDLLLRYYVKTGKFKRGLSLLDTIIIELPQYEEHIHPSRLVSIYYYMAYVYFGVQDYKNASVWINKILNNRKFDLRRDLLSFTRIFNLIIQFEKGDHLVLEYILRSAHHFIRKTNKLYRLEKLTLDFFKILYRKGGAKHQSNTFLTFKNDLIVLSKDPFEKYAFDYFDLISWAESKIAKKSFGEIIESKFQ